MSTQIKAIEEKLKKLEKGLYFISDDCERRLSNHEAVDLVNDLRAVVADALSDLDKL
jgi:transcription initiation factor IIE alpha subunit